jgi:hypothetical protein
MADPQEPKEVEKKDKLSLLDAFKAVILPQIVSFLTRNILGIKGFVISNLLKYGGRFLVDVFARYLKQKEREADQQKAKEEKDKVVNDPNSTVEQRGDAYEKFFNSGRK